jgi:hypothetical protein
MDPIKLMTKDEITDELNVMTAVELAFGKLTPDSIANVLEWVTGRYGKGMLLRVVKDAEDYTLSLSGLPDWPYWLINQDGEGMTLSECNLFGLLDREFKANF